MSLRGLITSSVDTAVFAFLVDMPCLKKRLQFDEKGLYSATDLSLAGVIILFCLIPESKI